MTPPSTRTAVVIGAPGADRAVVEVTLRDAGLQVTSLSEQDALASRALGAPSVVVLDDGSDRAERERIQARLLSHPRLHGAPLIVVADECTVESFASAISKGAAAYLARPLVADDFRDAALRLAAWPGVDTRDHDVRRMRIRRPLLLDIDFEVEGRPGRARGLILDVSAGGCRMELPRPVKRGVVVAFIPRACERSTDIRMSGVVRWHRVTPEGRHLAAVRFTGPGGMLAAQILGAK